VTDEMRTPPKGGWESLKVDELKAELEARGLPKSGKKEELIGRLVDDDLAQKDNVVAADDDEAAEPTPAGEAAEPTPAGEAAEQEGPAGGEAAAEAQDVETAEQAAPAKRRRGSAETTTEKPKQATPRRPDGELIVRARSAAPPRSRSARAT